MPILCSMLTQVTSLRSPGLPSSSSRSFGTMKQEMPFVPGGASGVRARTRWGGFAGGGGGEGGGGGGRGGWWFPLVSFGAKGGKLLVRGRGGAPPGCGAALGEGGRPAGAACGGVRFIDGRAPV